MLTNLRVTCMFLLEVCPPWSVSGPRQTVVLIRCGQLLHKTLSKYLHII